MTLDSIPFRLFERAAKSPYAPAYYIKEGGRWKPTNWRSYAKQVRTAGKSLMALGVAAKGSVSILGFNRAEWVIFDLAAMSVGAYASGVYTTCSPEEVQYIVHHCEASVILVENADQAAKIAEQRKNMPHLKHVVAMRGEDIDGVMSWDDFMAAGEDVEDADFDAALAALEPDGLATLI